MRILIATDTYPPTVNGAAQFSQRLARGLVARGHEVHVACPSATGAPSEGTDSDGVRLYQVRSIGYPLYNTFRICTPGTVGRSARQILARVRPDVLHVQDHFLLGRAMIKTARSAGVGTVATNHLMPQNVFDHVPWPRALRDPAARLLWWDVARIYRRVGVVTSPTPKAVELLGRATGVPAIPVSNGIDIARYLNTDQQLDYDATPVILFVGRLDQEKRVDDLLRAMARLSDGVAGRLEVVGDGSHRESWRALARQLGLGPDRVDFRGFLPDDELLVAYGRADVFCMPGVAELQSLATLEAMAAGKPVVAADAMALPHLVHHGVNGYLYSPGNSDELANRLTALLGDVELRRVMGKKSREIVAAHGFGHTLTKFEALYARVAGG